ncbi:MAG TPA: SRPBCC family protein [Pyrinomonadaceae bacterium]|nr:SRPBCC family protein [Pyrinomonadaceae bacterium]
MKTAIVIVASIIGVLVLIVAVMALIGSQLPRAHTASRSIVLRQPRPNVYAVIRDFKSAPAWRSDVKSIEVIETPGQKQRFIEHGSDDVNYELTEDVPNQRIVTRILSTDLGYSGQWTYELTDENGGTRVKITEDGDVSNVFFRFMSRYVFGHTSTIDTYLTALAKKFGESTTPQ